MFYIDAENKKAYDYVTYGRQFDRYRWYKPILTALLFVVFYLALGIALIVGAGVFDASHGGSYLEFLDRFGGGYDTFSVYDVMGSVVNLGQVVLMIPALWLAVMIVRDRPFRSYSSSRGGWDNGVFFKCLLVALFTVAVPIFVREYFFLGHRDFENKFTLISLILLLILGPIQCIAEEYVFRGLMMQTLGSWIRVPIIAVILQAVVFVLVHPYNNIGKLAILTSGLAMGLSAWLGRGLEASAAMHVANNMTAFLMQGFNLTTIETEVKIEDLYIDIAVAVAYVLVILILRWKTNLFSCVNRDVADIENRKYADKLARKEAKRQAKNNTGTSDGSSGGNGGKHYKH